MNIPKLSKSSTANREWQKKKETALFSYTVTRGSIVTRYTSDVPSFALAEAWLQHVGNREHNWCLLELLPDGRIFFMAISQNDVKKAVECNVLDTVDLVLLQRSEIVFSVGFAEDTVRFHDIEITTQPALPAGALTQYALKSTQPSRWPRIALGVAVVLLLPAAGFTFLTFSKMPEPIVITDMFSDYRTLMGDARAGDSIISNAQALAAYGLLLPSGWELSNIIRHGNTLIMNVVRTPDGLVPVIEQWLTQHSVLRPYANVTFDFLTITLPLTATLAPLEGVIRPSSLSVMALQNAALSLGWAVTSVASYGTTHKTSTWTLIKPKMRISELTAIMTAIQSQPITVTALTLTPSQAEFSAELTFTFWGS